MTRFHKAIAIVLSVFFMCGVSQLQCMQQPAPIRLHSLIDVQPQEQEHASDITRVVHVKPSRSSSPSSEEKSTCPKKVVVPALVVGFVASAVLGHWYVNYYEN